MPSVLQSPLQAINRDIHSDDRVSDYIPYSRKIWRGIKFGALADRPTDRQIKIRQYLIRVYTYVRKINNGCGQSRASARARAHCRSQLFFDVHARRCKILLLLTMSLYRFLTKAGMPSRVPSLTDKESKTPTPVRTCGLSARARGRGYIATYAYVSRPPNLNPPIFLFTLVGANPPNLMPAKFSGYTVSHLHACAVHHIHNQEKLTVTA